MNIGGVDLADLGLGSTFTDEALDETTTQDTFLTLMLKQLEYQDPFEPMDSSQFLTQLASFETAAGMQSLNDSFAALVDSMYSGQVVESAGLVGKTVMAQLGAATLLPGGVVNGAIDVPDAGAGAVIEITDSAGQLIRRIDATADAGTRFEFEWDGLDASGEPVPAGTYQFSASTSIDGEDVALGVLLSEQVRSVTFNGSGAPPTLNLASGEQIGFGDVLEIS